MPCCFRFAPCRLRAAFAPSRLRAAFAPSRLRAAFAPCRLRAAKLSSRRVAGVFFADALQAAPAPYTLAGGFCALFSCAALRSRTRGPFAPLDPRAAEFFCSLSLQGGRIFTYYSTSAAERQSYLAAKFVSPQNAPFRTQIHRGGVFHSTRGRKKYFKPAPSTLVVPCTCALRRGVRTSTCSACKMRLFLHIFPMQGIKLPSTGQTIGEDPNGCAAELHMMI